MLVLSFIKVMSHCTKPSATSVFFKIMNLVFNSFVHVADFYSFSLLYSIPLGKHTTVYLSVNICVVAGHLLLYYGTNV